MHRAPAPVDAGDGALVALHEDRRRRAAVEGFFEGARGPERDWRALVEERLRLGRRGRDMALSDLPGYAGLSERARTLRRTGNAISEDEAAYGPYLDRVRNGRKRLPSELERLKKHDPLDRFV